MVSSILFLPFRCDFQRTYHIVPANLFFDPSRETGRSGEAQHRVRRARSCHSLHWAPTTAVRTLQTFASISPTGANGPLRTLIAWQHRCGAARETGPWSIAQHFLETNGQDAYKPACCRCRGNCLHAEVKPLNQTRRCSAVSQKRTFNRAKLAEIQTGHSPRGFPTSNMRTKCEFAAAAPMAANDAQRLAAEMMAVTTGPQKYTELAKSGFIR